MKIYLDDARQGPDDWVKTDDVRVVIHLLERGIVDEISLDHDLGRDELGTGYDVLTWIEEQVATKGFKPPTIHIHTANASAREKMEITAHNIKKLYAQTIKK